MGKPGTFNHQDAQIIGDNVEDWETVKALYGEDIVKKHLKSDISIVVDPKDIQKQFRGSYGFIDGKATLISDPKLYNGKIEVLCKVACGNLWKLQPYISNEPINILDHLNLFLPPPHKKCIGLFTFQNGIQNSPKDFENMGNLILGKLPEKPLCIGFYNGTNGPIYGIASDLARFSNEWHLNAHSVITLRQMLATLSVALASYHTEGKSPSTKTLAKKKELTSSDYQRLLSHGSNVYWTHIAHSEAGLIAHEVLTTNNYCLFQQIPALDKFIKNHLITLTYGGVASIPDKVLLALNTYSKDDIAMFYASKHLDKYPKPRANEDKELKELAKRMSRNKGETEEKIYALLKSGTDKFFISAYPHISTKNGYTVKIVKSLVPNSEQPLIVRDHAFNSDTYQTELQNNLDTLREDFDGIYDCR